MEVADDDFEGYESHERSVCIIRGSLELSTVIILIMAIDDHHT